MTELSLESTQLVWGRYLLAFLWLSQTDLDAHSCNQEAPDTNVMHGLQTRMAFFLDNEDVISAAMTVTHGLLDKYSIDPRSIGR